MEPKPTITQPPVAVAPRLLYTNPERKRWLLHSCRWSLIPGFIAAIRSHDQAQVLVHWHQCHPV